jgi:hypothetical protein
MSVVIGHNPSVSTTSDPKGSSVQVAWMLVFAAALLLYASTASRTIGWQDSGQFVLRVVRGETTDPFGLACAHPLHFWLGTLAVKILPVQPPFAMALLSGLFGALAVANVFGIVRTLTNTAKAALLAALGLAVAHTFWRFSTFVEVYSISAATLTAEMWALVMWDRTRRPKWLVLMFLINGIGLANHDLALLTLPVIGIVLLLALKAHQACLRTFLASAVAWMLGCSIYLFMIVQEARADHNLTMAIRSALFGKFESQVLSHGPLLTYTAISIAFTLLSFPNLMLPVAAWGVARGRKLGIPPLSFWSLFTATLIHMAFVLRYAVIDQYTFLAPVYALIAVFSGIGIAHVVKTCDPTIRRWAIGLTTLSILLTPTVYPVAFVVTRHFHFLGGYARNKPYRDDYRYLFIPWGLGENSAQRMSTQAIKLASRGGVIITEDPMASFAVEYQRLMDNQPGVAVLPAAALSDLEQFSRADRQVVFVPTAPSRPPAEAGGFDWKRVGDLYDLKLKPTTRPVDSETGRQLKGR